MLKAESTQPPSRNFGSGSAAADAPRPASTAGRQQASGSLSAKTDWGYSIALLAIALSPRLLVALAFAREPVWDGHYYHFGATRIAEGLGYSEDVIVDGISVWKPWTHYPVGYSGFLAIFYRLFGSHIEVAPVVNAFVGAGLVVVVHRVARYMLGPIRARIAGALCALHPGLIAYAAVVMTEPTAAFFVLLASWVVLRRMHQPTAFLLAGFLLGLATLIRPVSLLCAPALVLLSGRLDLRGLRNAALATLMALLTLAPWTIRNCKVMDGCALVSTNGGWNLAIGALTESGRFRTLRAADGCEVVTGQVQQDRCWAQTGAEIIYADPKAWLRKVPKKLGQTYDHESFPVEYLHEAAPEMWPQERRIAGHGLLTLFHWLLMTAAALSPVFLITRTRNRVSFVTQALLLLSTAAYASYCFADPEHPFFALMVMVPVVAALPFPGAAAKTPAERYLMGLLLLTTITHAVFFGEDRYHLVISPVLCILAAAALRVRSVAAQPTSS